MAVHRGRRNGQTVAEARAMDLLAFRTKSAISGRPCPRRSLSSSLILYGKDVQANFQYNYLTVSNQSLANSLISLYAHVDHEHRVARPLQCIHNLYALEHLRYALTWCLELRGKHIVFVICAHSSRLPSVWGPTLALLSARANGWR